MAKTKAAGYRQEKDGTWTIDTKVKVDGEFRHFKKSGYATLGAAKGDFERAKTEFIKSKEAHHSIIFFEDLVEEYERMRSFIVDENTVQSDMCTFRVYLFPYFKGRLLKDVLNTVSIRDWYAELVDNKDYTSNKKSKVITRIKDFLKFAYMHKYIDATTYQDCDCEIYQVKYSKKAKTERVVWSNEEEQKFLEAISKSKKDSLMFRVFLCTSPRLGEFLALKPESFDYEHRKITIDHQVKNIKGQGAVLTEKLKTNESYRTIVIPQDLADELKEYIETFGIKEGQYLWYSFSKNNPLGRNTIRRLFNSYCNRAGVRQMNLHALRHNQAVKLASVCRTGEELETAARRLGHSPSMFLNTYANHVNDSKENELLSRIYKA